MVIIIMDFCLIGSFATIKQVNVSTSLLCITCDFQCMLYVFF